MRVKKIMINSVCRRRLWLSNSWDLGILGTSHFTHLMIFPRISYPLLVVLFREPYSSSYSTSAQKDELKRSFVVDYLVNSIGLSRDRAIALALQHGTILRFHGTQKADLRLSFLRSHGFDDAQIAKMVCTDPKVVFGYKETTLSRKFDFFYSIGFTKDDLPKLISSQRLFWNRSLDGWVIPLYETLKEVLGSDREILISLKRMRCGLGSSFIKDIQLNIMLLKEIGVPSSIIAYVLRTSPSHLLVNPDEFRGIVDEVKALGFVESKYIFAAAIIALASRSKSTRNRCFDIYKEWGFSENDIKFAFKKWPYCLLLSEKKLRGMLDFLVNRMGCEVETIAHAPQILTYNLRRRIIPRCSVIHVLVKKELLKKDRSLYSVVQCSEERFLESFVDKYHDVAAELLGVYQGKVNPFKEICDQKGEMEQS